MATSKAMKKPITIETKKIEISTNTILSLFFVLIIFFIGYLTNKIDNTEQRLNNKIEKIENKIDRLEIKVNNIESNQKVIINTLKQIENKVK